MRSILNCLVVIAGLSFISPTSLKAEITDSTFYGFTVKHEYTIKALPDSLYRYMTLDIGLWWSPLHTFSGNAANLILQPKANGCFCEKLADGGSVRHMTVAYAEPGKILRMVGALGPLQGMAVTGVMTLELKPDAEGTILIMTYTVGGYSPASVGSLAPMVDRVLGDQFGRLKAFAEKAG